jgi:hypothetical protein
MITTMQRRRALFAGLALVLIIAIGAGLYGLFASSGDSTGQYPANYASSVGVR